eukprot:SAG31_NODE_30195_length_384_cov_0.989474_1_plen_54_part_01
MMINLWVHFDQKLVEKISGCNQMAVAKRDLLSCCVCKNQKLGATSKHISAAAMH